MAYCTIQQLEDRLSSLVLAQHVPETGDKRRRILGGYIERASTRVDALLAVRYDTPAPPSPLLADICLAFALWQIVADRGGLAEMPGYVQIPYDEAAKLLDRLGTGTMRCRASCGRPQAPRAGRRHPSAEIRPDSPGMEYF